MKTTLTVNGMTCDHCKASVTKALEGLAGVTSVQVDLSTKQAVVEHDEPGPDVPRMKAAVEAIGFDVS
jgi:copper chaperone